MSAGNPLGYDYRPRHVERYAKLVVRNLDGSTEGKHPRDADVDVMREIHEPEPLLRVIRAKCLDCSAGSESEVRKCTAIGCALSIAQFAWLPSSGASKPTSLMRWPRASIVSPSTTSMSDAAIGSACAVAVVTASRSAAAPNKADLTIMVPP
jgi:hypothetical protein